MFLIMGLLLQVLIIISKEIQKSSTLDLPINYIFTFSLPFREHFL